MDLAFNAEERAFRQEMRDFFRTQIPAEIRDKAGQAASMSARPTWSRRSRR